MCLGDSVSTYLSSQGDQRSLVLKHLMAGFYLNLPFGALSALAIIILVKHEHSKPIKEDWVSIRESLAALDFVGTALCVGMITSILLPLQWGGITKAWDDKEVIACFIVVSASHTLNLNCFCAILRIMSGCSASTAVHRMGAVSRRSSNYAAVPA